MIIYRRIDGQIYKVDTESKVQKKVFVLINELNDQQEKIKKLKDKVLRLEYQVRTLAEQIVKHKKRGW